MSYYLFYIILGHVIGEVQEDQIRSAMPTGLLYLHFRVSEDSPFPVGHRRLFWLKLQFIPRQFLLIRVAVATGSAYPNWQSSAGPNHHIKHRDWDTHVREKGRRATIPAGGVGIELGINPKAEYDSSLILHSEWFATY
jgi:hypothetical protein